VGAAAGARESWFQVRDTGAIQYGTHTISERPYAWRRERYRSPRLQFVPVNEIYSVAVGRAGKLDNTQMRPLD
jgi:hypothetical protein